MRLPVPVRGFHGLGADARRCPRRPLGHWHYDGHFRGLFRDDYRRSLVTVGRLALVPSNPGEPQESVSGGAESAGRGGRIDRSLTVAALRWRL